MTKSTLIIEADATLLNAIVAVLTCSDTLHDVLVDNYDVNTDEANDMLAEMDWGIKDAQIDVIVDGGVIQEIYNIPPGVIVRTKDWQIL